MKGLARNKIGKSPLKWHTRSRAAIIVICIQNKIKNIQFITKIINQFFFSIVWIPSFFTQDTNNEIKTWIEISQSQSLNNGVVSCRLDAAIKPHFQLGRNGHIDAHDEEDEQESRGVVLDFWRPRPPVHEQAAHRPHQAPSSRAPGTLGPVVTRGAWRRWGWN